MAVVVAHPIGGGGRYMHTAPGMGRSSLGRGSSGRWGPLHNDTRVAWEGNHATIHPDLTDPPYALKGKTGG